MRGKETTYRIRAIPFTLPELQRVREQLPVIDEDNNTQLWKDGDIFRCEVIISVTINEMMNHNFEELMNLFEEKIIGVNGTLAGIGYSWIGGDVERDELHIRIEAQVDLI